MARPDRPPGAPRQGSRPIKKGGRSPPCEVADPGCPGPAVSHPHFGGGTIAAGLVAPRAPVTSPWPSPSLKLIAGPRPPRLRGEVGWGTAAVDRRANLRDRRRRAHINPFLTLTLRRPRRPPCHPPPRHAPCSLSLVARTIRRRCPAPGHVGPDAAPGWYRRHETSFNSRTVRLLERPARRPVRAGAQRDRARRHSPDSRRHVHAHLRSARRTSVPDRRHARLRRLRARAQGRGFHRHLAGRQPRRDPRGPGDRGHGIGRRGGGRIRPQRRRAPPSSSNSSPFRSRTGAAPAPASWARWCRPRSRIGSVPKRSGR